MPRTKRDLESNVVYHVYNRRVEKRGLFDSDDAYRKFLTFLSQAKLKYPVRLHAYCVMPTHWHIAVSAEIPASISRFVAWISTQDAKRYRAETDTIGLGHVYQGRFCAKASEGAVSYARLIRYIEVNPVAAELVTRAQDWPWSSVHERLGGEPTLIQPGPWRLPSNWEEVVNTPDVEIEMLGELSGQTAAFRPPPIVFE
jgi:putative transposase